MRAAVPLAILAGCQTLTMLTGGIDLSVARRRVDGGLRHGDPRPQPGGVPQAILVALAAAVLAGLVNGIAVGVFRVHPLIMTLGMSLIVLGLANVWQLQTVQTGSGVPDDPADDRLGDRSLDVIPNSLVVFVPVAAVHPPRASGGPATGGCSSPSATTRSPRGCRAPARGRS